MVLSSVMIRAFGRSSGLALAALLCLRAAFGEPAAAQSFQTAAPTAVLFDVATHSVLFEKEADKGTPPASLVKLMTALVVFEEIAKGRLALDDEMTVSVHAWQKGGAVSGNAAMFVIPRQKPKVGELLRGLSIVSGNDAALTLAEGISGSEENFARLMNERGRALGLSNSVFTNPTGLADPGQHVSMRDLIRIADRIIEDHPTLYPIFSEPEFTWGKTRQLNRNPLIGSEPGADGLQTGNSAEGGYGIVASAVRDGQRLIVAINGLKSAQERAQEARKMLDWGFRNFEPRLLFRAGEPIEAAKVYGGVQGVVDLVAAKDVIALVPRGDIGKMSAVIRYNGPLVAPVEKGAKVGILSVRRGDVAAVEVPVLTAAAIERGTLTQRAEDAIVELGMRAFRQAFQALFAKRQT